MSGGTETWRPIPGYEGHYEASNEGAIRSYVPWRGLPVPRPLTGSYGGTRKMYQHVTLRDADGNRKSHAVHALIAKTFLGPRPDGQLVRHLDGDTANNAVSNLRYGTPTENLLDTVAHGRHFHAKRDACHRGHPYTPENTGPARGGTRRCRACVRLDSKRYRAAKRDAA